MGIQNELTSHYIREVLREYLSDSEGNILLERKRFLDELREKEVLTALELAQIRTLEKNGSGVGGLIEILSRSSVKQNLEFLQCLKKAGRKSGVCTMNCESSKELLRHYISHHLQDYLSDSRGTIFLEKKRFLDVLRENDIISSQELGRIRANNNDNGHGVGILIDIMGQSSLQTNNVFLRCLHKLDQFHVEDNTPHTGLRYWKLVFGAAVVTVLAIFLHSMFKPDPRFPIAKKFREEYSRIPQWTSPDAWPVLQENAYTPMTWVVIDRTHTRVAMKELDDYHPLLLKTHWEPLYLLITGDHGIGKSTFIRNFAYTWAASVINPYYLSGKTNTVMGQFDYVLPLKLIDLRPNDTLFSFISGQFRFLEQDCLVTVLNTVSTKPDRSLCIFDGYNEMTDDPPQEVIDVIHRKNTSFCSNIVITSAEDKAVFLRRQLGLTGREALLKGFNTEQSKLFVDNCYGQNDQEKAQFIKMVFNLKDTLEFRQNPLRLQMLCAHWINKNTRRLLNRLTTLYMESLVIILRRHHIEKRHGSGLSMDKLLDVYTNPIKALGRLGWHGCSQEMYKCPSTFTVDVIEEKAGMKALELGLLKYIMPDLTSEPAKFRFPYSRFQEFIIALGHHLGNNELMPGIFDEGLFQFAKSLHAENEEELHLFIHNVPLCKTDEKNECYHKSYNEIRIYYISLTQYRRFRSVWQAFGYRGKALIAT